MGRLAEDPRLPSRARERAALHVADMGAPPRLGEFDLVRAVNDAVNYLLVAGELKAGAHSFEHLSTPARSTARPSRVGWISAAIHTTRPT